MEQEIFQLLVDIRQLFIYSSIALMLALGFLAGK